MKYNIYMKITILLLVIGMLNMVSCSKKSEQLNQSDIIGGDAVCYSYCVYNDSFQLATIPIISKQKILSARLNSVQTDVANVFSFEEAAFDLSETFEYNGYNVYFLSIKISCIDNSSYKKVNVNSITVELNDEIHRLETPNFTIENGINGIDNTRYNDGSLLFGGLEFTTLLNSSMPLFEFPKEIGIVAEKDLIVNSFCISNYFQITSMTEGEKEVNPNQINNNMQKGDSLILSYSLDYLNGSNENTIVRAAQIFTYTDETGVGAFISGAGEYLYLGQKEQTVIKNYIDSKKIN